MTEQNFGGKSGPSIDAVERCAKIAHEINRAYCAAIDDHTQLPWSEAPTWQVDSAIAGVRFHLANPDAGPEASHLSWYRVKEAEGWKYGPVKNAETKEHPCFVAFHQLTLEQQIKDHLFRAVVHAYFD